VPQHWLLASADYALIIYVRAAPDRTGRSTADVGTQLADGPSPAPNARGRRPPGVRL